MHTTVLEEPEGKRRLGRAKCRGRTGHHEEGHEAKTVTWIQLVQDRVK
jgi:hypothetical protein